MARPHPSSVLGAQTFAPAPTSGPTGRFESASGPIPNRVSVAPTVGGVSQTLPAAPTPPPAGGFAGGSGSVPDQVTGIIGGMPHPASVL